MVKKILLMMVFAALLLAGAGGVLFMQYATIATPKQTTPKNPIVIELFTSQGCSSCPPADKIFGELAKKDNVITLGCHVSYWDSRHQKDTLAQDFCDVRQHGYIGMQGSQRIYTPQMVVNGRDLFVGSNQDEITLAMAKAQETKILPITITKNENSLNFMLPQAEEAGYRLWGFGFKKAHHKDIVIGENKGLTIDYTTPAITYSNLGPWDGSAKTESFEQPEGDIDGIVIFAQKDGYGEITAAGKLVF